MATLAAEAAPAPGAPTDEERRNRELALRWFAAMNARDLDATEELFAPDYRLHLPEAPEDLRGPAAIRAVIEGYVAAFPDLRFTVLGAVAEGDTVVVRWRAEGTQRGALGGAPATGRAAGWTGTSWLRFAGGRVAEDWVEHDTLGMMRQLGLLPAPPAVGS